MNIVVWKSPRALRGILRVLFGVKAEKNPKTEESGTSKERRHDT